MQQAGTAVFRMDDMEFGRRLAVERELEKVGAGIGGTAWDETGGFLLYPTMLGIKGEFTPIVSGRSPRRTTDQTEVSS